MFLVDTWLSLQPFELILALAAFYTGAAALLLWLSFGSWTGRLLQSCRGVVPPFFGAVAVLFALFLGFLANDVWARHKQASQAVLTERDGLLAIHDLCEASGHVSPDMDEAIRAYANVVVEREWPLMADQQASPQAAAALDQVLKAAVRANRGALDRTIVDAALKVRSARGERLALSLTFTDDIKWLTILILGLMTQVAIAVVHLDNWRAQAAALAIFSAAAVSTLSLVAFFEGPFEPPFFVGPKPIQEVLQLVPAHTGEGASAAAPGGDTLPSPALVTKPRPAEPRTRP